MSTLNPVEKLSHLSSQRTARTDRLESVTHALLGQLKEHTAVGTCVSVDGWSLGLYKLRSNVGINTFWMLSDGDSSCHLDIEVGAERYMHNDFNCPLIGPTRAQLIAFGEWSQRFVAALIAVEEKRIAKLDAAAAQVELASSSIT